MNPPTETSLDTVAATESRRHTAGDGTTYAVATGRLPEIATTHGPALVLVFTRDGDGEVRAARVRHDVVLAELTPGELDVFLARATPV